MKRVINGHACNTETATLVARRVQRVQMDGVSVSGVAYEEADVVHEFYARLGEVFCFQMWNVLVDGSKRPRRRPSFSSKHRFYAA